jgi:hypothetical protein
MKINAKKAGLWIGCVLLINATVIGIVWVASGFGAAERSVDAAYREVEALGFPLGADAFAASFAPSPEENNAPELEIALKNLGDSTRDFSKGVKEAATQYSWYKKEDVIPVAERIKAFELYKPAMDKVRSATQKPHFVPNKDWAHAVSVLHPEFAQLRSATKISSAESVLLALQGNRNLALQRLRESFRYANLASETPVLISKLVQIALLSITTSAVSECIIADPEGATEYGATLSDVKVKPIGFYVRGEVYNIASIHRVYTSIEAARFILNPLKEDIPESKVNPPRKGLPRDPAWRALLGHSLNELLPMLRELNPDGSFRDEAAFWKAAAKMEKRAGENSHAINVIHSLILPSLTRYVESLNDSDARFATVSAFAKVVAFRNKHGFYPAALAEAGVTTVDPFSDEGKPLGYSAKDGKMRVWSIGRNKVDDKGLTDREALARDEKDTKYPSYRNGDIVFVMRPPGTMVHP